jgi:MerR family mercuric resistance operon transcriptional regulator
LVIDGHDACQRVPVIAMNHLGTVRARIANLRAMEHVLADAVERCTGDLPRCPIVDTLSQSPSSPQSED